VDARPPGGRRGFRSRDAGRGGDGARVGRLGDGARPGGVVARDDRFDAGLAVPGVFLGVVARRASRGGLGARSLARSADARRPARNVGRLAADSRAPPWSDARRATSSTTSSTMTTGGALIVGRRFGACVETNHWFGWS